MQIRSIIWGVIQELCAFEQGKKKKVLAQKSSVREAGFVNISIFIDLTNTQNHAFTYDHTHTDTHTLTQIHNQTHTHIRT